MPSAMTLAPAGGVIGSTAGLLTSLSVREPPPFNVAATAAAKVEAWGGPDTSGIVMGVWFTFAGLDTGTSCIVMSEPIIGAIGTFEVGGEANDISAFGAELALAGRERWEEGSVVVDGADLAGIAFDTGSWTATAMSSAAAAAAA